MHTKQLTCTNMNTCYMYIKMITVDKNEDHGIKKNSEDWVQDTYVFMDMKYGICIKIL